jgi:hypothetical protein
MGFVDRSEVAVPVDQHGAALFAELAAALEEQLGAEVLRHAHQRVVDRCVTCGWYFCITSPTARAHLRSGRSGRSPASHMAYRIRRCTGLSPSRTSGSARPTIPLIE